MSIDSPAKASENRAGTGKVHRSAC